MVSARPGGSKVVVALGWWVYPVQLRASAGLGANTASRCESGRNVRTAAMDMLFLLIRDLPGCV